MRRVFGPRYLNRDPSYVELNRILQEYSKEGLPWLQRICRLHAFNDSQERRASHCVSKCSSTIRRNYTSAYGHLYFHLETCTQVEMNMHRL
jgi:hypothetical protein